MTPDWHLPIPELTTAQHDFLRVLRAAVAGRPCERPPIAWGPVLGLAVAHQVADFLYPRVSTWPLLLQPPPADMSRWRIAFFGAVARYTRGVVQTREILAALRQAGVQVIPLKGVWLAERIYDDGACRSMVDIDLLVTPPDLDRAQAVLEQLGYATDDFSPEEAGGKHLRFRKPGAPLPLELHWRLWHTRDGADDAAAHERVWASLDNGVLHGVSMLVFPVEREIVYLADHILGHDWSVPLKAYLDFALLCDRFGPRLDVARLEREADAWGISFGARFVVQVAADLFGDASFAPMASFLREAAACSAARRGALVAAVQLSPGSKRITPALAASLRCSRGRRLVAGLGRVWLEPAEVRLVYPRVVRRWGLIGGYLWRGTDLVRRHGSTMLPGRHVTVEDAADAANFDTRRTLGDWIGERNTASV